MAKYQIVSNNSNHCDDIISLGDMSIYIYIYIYICLILHISCKSASKCILKLPAFDVA